MSAVNLRPVPLEPTEVMVKAGLEAADARGMQVQRGYIDEQDCRTIYAAMVAARPGGIADPLKVAELVVPEDPEELYETAKALVIKHQKASTSWMQRHLRIGYNQAARLTERMEAEGVISAANTLGRRDVLVSL
jgi:DNA segregation ATPase FtsK/SpoIIIE-like protein